MTGCAEEIGVVNKCLCVSADISNMSSPSNGIIFDSACIKKIALKNAEF